MSRYIVKFMKNVLGENGREVEICQSTVEIDAPSKSEAAERAKKQFCAATATTDWSLHADRMQVIEADFPS
jgi:hypothetical protein